jgi:hypothetical protein
MERRAAKRRQARETLEPEPVLALEPAGASDQGQEAPDRDFFK